MVMVKESFMVKSSPAKKVLPCGASGCTISTNKRYRSPGDKSVVACTYTHAERAHLGR